jgi:hypothetical protein
MKPRQLKKITLNKSDFGGYNWLNVFAGILFFIGVLYTAYLATFSGNPFVVILKFSVVVIVFLLLVIGSVNFFSYLLLKDQLSRGNEDILFHGYGSLTFDRSFQQQPISLPELNLVMLDVIFAYTSRDNLYISPTVSYTKQTLLKIPRTQIRSIDLNQITILRQTEEDAEKLQDAMATTAGNTGIFIPVGEIQDTLDNVIPIQKILLAVETSDGIYQIAITNNRPGKRYVREIIELFRG